jgi:DNA mismatch repair ATPase MutL
MLMMKDQREDDDLFALAGITKNAFEDKWEFVASTAASTTATKCQPPLPSPPKTTTTPTTPTPRTTATSKAATTQGRSVNDEDKASSHATPTPSPLTDDPNDTANTLKQKKKNHKKKKRSKSTTSVNDDSPREDLHVQWGTVEQLRFTRMVGLDAVPSDGFFPLGLGDFEDKCCFTVDELFARQQLREHLALQELEQRKATQQLPTRASTRIRKGSFDLAESPKDKDKEKEKKHSSLSPKAKSEGERIELLRDFVEISQSNNAIHVELESLRNSRDCVGCTCKPLKPDKLNVGKLKMELMARKHLLQDAAINVEKLKKNDLLHYLKEVLKSCPTCISNDCECFRMEIPCAGNACDCVFRPGESESCTNVFGSRTFDPDRVSDYRQKILQDIIKP